MTEDKARPKVKPSLAELHGQQVDMVSAAMIEDDDGVPQAVERVVESGVLFIPDCLRGDDDEDEEDYPEEYPEDEDYPDWGWPDGVAPQ